MFCPSCGQARKGAERFCVNCGTDLSKAPAAEPAPVPPPVATPPAATPVQAAPAPPLPAAPVAAAPAPGSLVGVDGWLLLFCVWMTVLGPLVEIARMVPLLRYVSGNLWLLLSFAVTAYGIFTGVMLWTRNPNALICLRVYFGLILLFAFVGFFSFFRAVRMAGTSFEMFPVVASWVRVAAFLGIWVTYFRISKRVRATYGANL